MVRVKRLELLRVAPLEPKSSASANSAIPARHKMNYNPHKNKNQLCLLLLF